MNNYSLQMPDILEVAEDSDNFGTFILQPLERGFGVTIGNSFRRVLLSSLPGLAITAVRINGVDHEYSSIEGVKEDEIGRASCRERVEIWGGGGVVKEEKRDEQRE